MTTDEALQALTDMGCVPIRSLPDALWVNDPILRRPQFRMIRGADGLYRADPSQFRVEPVQSETKGVVSTPMS